MISRRNLIKLGVGAAGAYALRPPVAYAQTKAVSTVGGRPPVSQRKFTSEAVERVVAEVKHELGETKLARLFENCFPNTLDTTVRHGTLDGKPDTFVITGDIPAMWLRDSSAQVWPYIPLAKEDLKLRALLAGVIHRQARSINIDPYANAFNFDREGGEWQSDETQMRPELHERKWEIDSLCYPVRLAHGYWKTFSDSSVFDDQWQQCCARHRQDIFRAATQEQPRSVFLPA